MKARDRLNAEHYQQAVQSAQYFAKEDQQPLLAEIADRYSFEQTQQKQALLQNQPIKQPLARYIWVALCVIFVLSAGYYWQTERWDKVQSGQQAFNTFQQQKHAQSSDQRNDSYIISLQNQLRQNANNGELWFELGQAYSLNNDFESALVCFDYAQRLLGAKPAILGAMATADYYQHKQNLTPQATAWIAQALKVDPTENASLLLLASDAFLQNQFHQAIRYWEQVLDSENPAVNRRAIIQSIKMARERAETSDLK